ncbi:MAG TPA: flagellin [Sphingomonas sp.]|nr:flagellin [Sphingomonas sp.]
MAFSVNTNAGAMAALQSLNATNKRMDVTQSRINTGLSVGSTKDDSAKYTIAQTLRGDLGGLNAVTSSLNNAKSVTDTAIAGAEQISDLLNQMKSKAYEAADAGLTTESRAAVGKDFDALLEQVNTIIKSSEFNNTNLLDDTFTGTKTVAALQSLDATSTLAVGNQALDVVAGTITGGIADATGALGSAMVGTLDTAIGNVNTKLSTLGAASRKIEGQLSFTSKLSDVVTTGIGNLVDADLAKESANLQALQVRQQLGVQALSIANQAPQTILSLFR